MKHNYSAKIVLAISLALIVLLAGCSNDSSTDNAARIYVQGAGGATAMRSLSAASAAGGFASGDVEVNDDRITEQLKPSNDSTVDTGSSNANDTVYEAVIENVPTTITLSVEPKPGFVFNEWSFNIRRAVRDGLDWHEIYSLMLTPSERYAESLTVRAENAKYYIATFERGYYIDLDANENGDGTKSNPYNTFDIKNTNIVKPGTRDEDVEITFKVAGNFDGTSQNATLNLASMASLYGRNTEVEEIRILGGYERTNGSDWVKSGRSHISLAADGGIREMEIEEIEISSVHIEELDYEVFRNTEAESDDIEFFDVSVGKISKAPEIIANLVIESTDGLSGKVFVNSVVDKVSPSSQYIHSLIKSVEPGTEIDGFNNIVLSDTHSGKYEDNNYYLPADTEVIGYVLNGEINSDLLTAEVYSEREFEYATGLDDDVLEILENDIAGRERSYDEDDDGRWSLSSRNTSYGPYEYLDIDMWDRDRDDWFDDWDDHWDD